MDLTKEQKNLVAETMEFRSFDVAERATELEKQAERADTFAQVRELTGEANRLRMLEQELKSIRDLAMQKEEPS